MKEFIAKKKAIKNIFENRKFYHKFSFLKKNLPEIVTTAYDMKRHFRFFLLS